VFRRGQRFRVPKKLRFPLFVKSTTDDASLGIAQASVVEDAQRLKDRIEFVFEQNKSDVLVEEYIEGREVYVGVVGNERLTRLPFWEMEFGTMPANQSAIATRKVKWDRAYQQKYGIVTAAAKDLPAGVEAQLDRLSRRIFRALNLSGYARMDFRVRADGSVFALEANANPNLAREEDFAQSAAAAGSRYDDVLQRILSLGLAYRVEWRVLYG
jgi:D-alanine-D-alanine ligase